MPDIGNLRRLARLLGVSVDYLLDDGEDAEAATRALREPIDLTSADARRSADSGWSIKAAKKDVIVRGMWPDATIHRLVSEPILTHDEKVVDNVLGFLTPAGFGIPQILDSVRDRRDRYYLVDRGTFQLLVTHDEKVVDNVLGFLTPAGFGIPQILDSVRDRRDRYYLVDRGTFQLLVTVSDEFVESRRLAEHVNLRRGAHFAVGAVRLTVAAPLARA